MFTLINLNNPLRSAIILYIIILSILFALRPTLIKNEKHKYILPIIIIMVSTISYYIFAILHTILN
jgi:hypothetical protein